MTIVYLGGHIVMYVGNAKGAFGQTSIPMTYQNIWGLTPPDQSTRYVIGKAVFLPLLLQYPENPTLVSLANKTYFQVSNLNQMPSNNNLNVIPRLRELVGL